MSEAGHSWCEGRRLLPVPITLIVLRAAGSDGPARFAGLHRV